MNVTSSFNLKSFQFMKKSFNFTSVVLTIATIISFQGCKKDIDCRDLEDLKLCDIKKVVVHRSFYNDTALFFYNAFGNPKAVNVTNVGTGNPNYVFKYDASQRLSQAIGVYTNGNFENWHKYTYGPGNRVIVDTTYTFGLYNGGAFPSNYYYHSIGHYQYYAEGRIIKITRDFLLPVGNPSSVTTYSYDMNGNLIKPGVVYDDKINFHRTNKVWMFLDRDYSRNNPMTASSYNPYLPLKFNQPAAYPYYLLSLQVNVADISYDCKVPGYKGLP